MTVAALPDSQVLAANRCASCPKMCRSACPTLAVTANERHQPWGHARTVVAAPRSPRGFADPAVVDAAFTCALCAACTLPCKVDGVETPELSWAVRAAVFAAGATPTAALRAVAEAGDARVPERDGRDPTWADPAPTLAELRSLATPGADLLFHPGCGALGRRPGAVLDAGRALRALNVPFAVLEEHRCCGRPALDAGDTDALSTMLTHLGRTVAATGARRVAVQSPTCAHLLAQRAPRLGLGLPVDTVEPLATVLARALTDRTVTPPTGAHRTRAIYHDPCHLARHLDCTAPPRDALSAVGLEIVELRGHGPTTACSGGGGLLPLTHPDVAAGYVDRLAAQITEATAAGAHLVVTGCGTCAARLAGAAHVPVLELAEVIAGRVRPPGDAPWR